MISTSHLGCWEILNTFSKRKQIDLLSVVKWLKFYSDWVVSHLELFKISFVELFF